MTGFVKLYGTILTSSIWLEDHATLRVWIAMLATADKNGVVEASVGGLGHVSRVTREECQKALSIFMEPDEDSRTPDNEGRRVEAVKGGWRILNHQAYRDLRTDEQVKEAERKAQWRAKQSKGGTVPDCPVSPSPIQTDVEAEAYAEADVPPPPPPADDESQSPTGSTAQTMVSVVPAEFRPDMRSLMLLVPNVTAWTAEMRAAIEGMHGKPITAVQLGQAVRDYLGSGKAKSNPSLRSFRRYMQGVLEVNGTAPHSNGMNGKRGGPKEYDYSKPTDNSEGKKWQT